MYQLHTGIQRSVNFGAVVRNEETIDGLNTYAFDMDKANQVLDEAGWVRGADGIREKTDKN